MAQLQHGRQQNEHDVMEGVTTSFLITASRREQRVAGCGSEGVALIVVRITVTLLYFAIPSAV